MIRLYLNQPLAPEQSVALSRDHAHYLFGVMRLKPGAEIEVFDGVTGAYRAQVAETGKRGGVLTLGERTRPLQQPPDLWLLFAPIKKARTDFIVEKAAEMGAARICPVQTEFTNSERIRRDRLQAHAIEATEQCGGTFVPEVADLERLDQVLAHWDPARQILFCDETLPDTGGLADLARGGPWAVLIGPEGGFSPTERAKLHSAAHIHPISLGPRILRADTAAVAALTLWQSTFGDW